MLLLVKCYDNKKVKLPGFSSIGTPLTNNKKIMEKVLRWQSARWEDEITKKAPNCKKIVNYGDDGQL